MSTNHVHTNTSSKLNGQKRQCSATSIIVNMCIHVRPFSAFACVKLELWKNSDPVFDLYWSIWKLLLNHHKYFAPISVANSSNNGTNCSVGCLGTRDKYFLFVSHFYRHGIPFTLLLPLNYCVRLHTACPFHHLLLRFRIQRTRSS